MMAAPLIALIPTISSLLGGVLDMLTGDKKAQAEALLKQLDQASAAQQGQLEINKAEASNPSLFVSGWRPGIGWVCVAAFTYQFVAYPFIVWYCTIKALPQPPALNDVLWELTCGMLGLGGLRSIDKIKGKQHGLR